MNQKIKRPLVRYHGGKYLLADWIISHFPEHRGYVEAFGGGGSVLMKKRRSYFEVYNDLDGEMVNLFRVVRDQGEQLLRSLELTPFSREEYVASCEDMPTNHIDWARKTVFRSFAGFGSAAVTGEITGFRANNNRSSTTPAHDWRNYPDCFPAFISRLRGVVIENKGAIEVMRQHDAPDVLHYIDPPYVHSTRNPGRRKKQYRYEMTDADHEQLLKNVIDLVGFRVISAYECDLYNDLLAGWYKIAKSSYADGQRDRVEILWLSPNIPINNPLFL